MKNSWHIPISYYYDKSVTLYQIFFQYCNLCEKKILTETVGGPTARPTDAKQYALPPLKEGGGALKNEFFGQIMVYGWSFFLKIQYWLYIYISFSLSYFHAVEINELCNQIRRHMYKHAFLYCLLRTNFKVSQSNKWMRVEPFNSGKGRLWRTSWITL